MKVELIKGWLMKVASNKQLVQGMFLLHKSKYFLTEDNPKLLSIFGNIFIMSKLTKIEFNGKSREFLSCQ